MKPPASRILGTLLCLLAAFHLAGCQEEVVPVQELFALRNQGLLFLERGQLAEAETQFARLVELAPDEPLGHANLGLTHLRAGRFQEAESHLLRARRLDPGSIDIGLILARLYEASGRAEEARQLLLEMREAAAGDVRVLYALAELDQRSTDPAAASRHLDALRRILELEPSNLPVRLWLAEALLRQGATDSVLRHLEEVRRIPPEPPADAAPLLDEALSRLRSGAAADAAVSLARFHQAMQVTAPYQAAIAAMGWVEGPVAGRPVLTFAPEDFIALQSLQAEGGPGIAFVDATAEVGLPEPPPLSAGAPAPPAVLAHGDVNGDGREDLLVAGAAHGGAKLFIARPGQYQDATAESALGLTGELATASFGDVDNDGWTDLLAVEADGAVRLFRNGRTGQFEEMDEASLPVSQGVTTTAFVDVDHDGDLDLILAGPAGISLQRNNLDGTFSDVTAAYGLANVAAGDVDFADLDGDGRVDLVFSGADGVSVFRNVGARSFSRIGVDGGTGGAGAVSQTVIEDVDNDGILDLVSIGAGAAGGVIRLGKGDGTFEVTGGGTGAFSAPDAGGAVGLEALDYDNDGRRDLVVTRAGSTPAVRLLHNEGDAVFAARPDLMPGLSPRGWIAEALDADDDGDQDVLIAGAGGVVRLLRNDGGNVNRAVRVELHALGAGSGKNNDAGIGARLELRVGEQLQTRVVTDRVTHFGLGPHLKADVLRVEWPNGVPQTLYFPGSDQDVLELENLKGSCAFLYTWNGTGFTFVTDVTWRSALGMPLGLMGSGSTRFAPAGASEEYLRVPGEALRPRNGLYEIQLTEELWETAYMDEVRLLAVDHPDSIDIFVDERFLPPGPVELRVYRSSRPHPPLSAVDGAGADLLPRLREKDDVYVSNLVPLRYQGLVEEHELVLDLGPRAGVSGSLLVLRGWIYPTDASINVALSQQTEIAPMAPVLEVRDASGRWVPARDLSFPSGKDKTTVVELDGLFPTADHRVRIRTNLQIYWDQAFVSYERPGIPMEVTTLRPLEADLHYRGFSRMYRKGGRYGPHWFAYDEVTEESPWRTIEGSFTRYGAVLPLLAAADDRYVVMGPGDEMTVRFEATGADDLPAGWRRDFLLYTVGWIKDADHNTAFGNTVEPLPFHGIEQYPYADGDAYPADAEHRRYLEQYNTRVVGGR